MGPIRKRLSSVFGPWLLLTIVASLSVCLNTNVSSVPRFDGAGYAVLGQALGTGRGYCEINRPGAPRHDHFPPGYPFTLAILWEFTGRSVVAAHLFSAVCTILAVLLGWNWFRVMYPPRTALVLALALAINWTWGRIGGSIQSEPCFMVWELLAILTAIEAVRYGTFRSGAALGLALGVVVLTRHVGICIAVAVVLDLALSGRWKLLLVVIATATLLVFPWAIWLLMVHHHTQLALLTTQGLTDRIAGQVVFYLQRFPDQLMGPFVEVGTVFKRSPVIVILANLWAMLFGIILVGGWVKTLRTPRRRLVGLIAFITLSLLVLWPFTEAGRFLIPLIPMMLVGLTEGLAYVIRQARVKRPRDWAVTILLSISVPYSAYAIINGRAEAQRRIHLDFDRACQWITSQARGSGPILTQYPGEVFWQTGHYTVEPDSTDPGAIDGLIEQLGVSYLLIDNNRYANAGSNPLQRYVKQYPDRVRLVWGNSHDNLSVQVFEIIRSKPQAQTDPKGVIDGCDQKLLFKPFIAELWLFRKAMADGPRLGPSLEQLDDILASVVPP